MVAASRILIVLTLAAIAVGCSGGSDPAPTVGEVTTSKAGAEAIKKNGGKPMPRSADMVPSADD